MKKINLGRLSLLSILALILAISVIPLKSVQAQVATPLQLAQAQVWVQWFAWGMEKRPLYVCTTDTGGSLNLRTGPEGSVVAQIPNNTLLIATGEVISPGNANNPFQWVEVFYSVGPNTSHIGWVAVAYLCE